MPTPAFSIRTLALIALTCLAPLSARAQPVMELDATRDGSTSETNSAFSSTPYQIGEDLPYAYRVLEVHMEAFSELNEQGAGVPTGVLYDRALPMRDISQYSGSSYTAISYPVWTDLYFNLYTAAYEKRGMETPESLASAVSDLEASNVVPIVSAFVEYNGMKENAYEDNMVEVSGNKDKVVRGPNDASPYDRHTFLAATPSKKRFTVGESISFDFSEQLYTTNTGHDPQETRIDFDDGARFRGVSLGDRITLSYRSAGTKKVRMRMRVDGETRETAFTLNVRQTDSDLEPDPEITNTSAEANYEGETVGYEHYGFFGDGNSSLQRPVIFLDGIDFGDATDVPARGLIELYEGQLNATANLEGRSRGTADILRDEGFDLFILNYANGATNIRRNAFTLVDLLDFINEKTNGTKKVTVIGPSMGGVVSRYALAYMEHERIEHNVDLFVSYDSPQQGANVPIGIQELTDQFPLGVGVIRRAEQQLSLPAARELIVYNSLNEQGTSDPLREQLLSDLEAYGGYPSGPRMVAVANGDGYGEYQKNEDGVRLEPSAEILEVELLDDLPLLYEYAQRGYAAPDYQRGKILESAHYLSIDPPFFPEYRIKVGGIERYADTLPFDSAPGGRRGFAGEALIPGFFETLFGGEHFYEILTALGADTRTDFPAQSFIPTVSALDYNTSYPQDYTLKGQNLFYPVLNDSKSERRDRTPFDRIFAHSENTGHVLITPAAEQFVLGEIRCLYGTAGTLVVTNETISGHRDFENCGPIRVGPNVAVESSGDLALRASDSIVLEAGFSAELGSSFSAVVDPEALQAPEPTVSSTEPVYATSTSETESGSMADAGQQGEESSSGASDTDLQATLSSSSREALPDKFSLASNYPNPFKRRTQLRYTLPRSAHVLIEVYDMLGRKVAQLVNERHSWPAGTAQAGTPRRYLAASTSAGCKPGITPRFVGWYW